MNPTEGLSFAPIDLARHAQLCIAFRSAMYRESFGTEAGLAVELGPGGGTYLAQLFHRLELLPEGNAHLWRGDAIVGQTEMSLLEEEPGVGYVHLFYLTPSERGRGVGRLLHQHAAAVLKSRGMERMRLSVAERNQAAIAFYDAMGWRRIGNREHREPMHVMEFQL
jgi:ribosomal protein S18 acetylase RimI-like enzyme